MSKLPLRSESNASQRPSALTSTVSMVSLPVVIRVAPRTETGPRAGTGRDQTADQLLRRE